MWANKMPASGEHGMLSQITVSTVAVLYVIRVFEVRMTLKMVERGCEDV